MKIDIFYLPIPVPLRLNCEAFIPRALLATSPKSHPSPYLLFSIKIKIINKRVKKGKIHHGNEQCR